MVRASTLLNWWLKKFSVGTWDTAGTHWRWQCAASTLTAFRVGRARGWLVPIAVIIQLIIGCAAAGRGWQQMTNQARSRSYDGVTQLQ